MVGLVKLLVRNRLSITHLYILVCRLISNQFTADGIRHFAEALTHNTKLKEIW